MSMDDIGPLLRLLPALLVILFLVLKKKKQKKPTDRPTPPRVRRAREDGQDFKRDYEPIEPS
jgi:hypothetical protein